MIILIEDYEEFILPLNLFENEKQVIDFCEISENIDDLQTFRNTCFSSGRGSFIHIIDKRIDHIKQFLT